MKNTICYLPTKKKAVNNVGVNSHSIILGEFPAVPEHLCFLPLVQRLPATDIKIFVYTCQLSLLKL
jgi:hypothetical protein